MYLQVFTTYNLGHNILELYNFNIDLINHK